MTDTNEKVIVLKMDTVSMVNHEVGEGQYDFSKMPDEFEPYEEFSLICKDHGEFKTSHMHLLCGHRCGRCEPGNTIDWSASEDHLRWLRIVWKKRESIKASEPKPTKAKLDTEASIERIKALIERRTEEFNIKLKSHELNCKSLEAQMSDDAFEESRLKLKENFKENFKQMALDLEADHKRKEIKLKEKFDREAAKIDDRLTKRREKFNIVKLKHDAWLKSAEERLGEMKGDDTGGQSVGS